MKFGDKHINIGIMFRREHTPEQLPAFARSAESAGYDELWVVEDCFYGSGIASATTALAVTDSVVVGLGIMPAVARNPVFAAMEIATLARIYPDRFLPGFGHGVAEWMQQIGALPASQLKALEETTVTVKRLLKGERVNFGGEQVNLSECQLFFPPSPAPPISLGVRGQKSLRLAGRSADGTILAEFASPAYVKWARQQIAAGQAESGAKGHHRLTVFVMAYFGDDAQAYEAAKARVVGAIYRERIDAQLEPMGILEQVVEMRERRALEAEIPEDWVRELAMVGGRESCAETVRRYIDAGVDSLVLVAPPEQSLAMPDDISAHLMQYLK
jgi:alkanesulfonate monooxygenase SsuD/methylene tetrahydromethanopterin reductase-like flavin-dependent oxidoreductase (luciferase family)